LVENRRTLMARQIKLRRDQQKQRKALLSAAADVNSTAAANTVSSPWNSGSEQEQPCVSKSSDSKTEEPLRVPPLLPVIQRPQLIDPRPRTPVIAQPTPLLPAPLFVPPLDLRFMPLNYHLINPMPFQFTPVLPYASALPFLSAL
uniref:BZIP domain-containing protein n=1 Tax=Gongylonema pulchrum TaxID=637853 RepID=A0A183E0E9_9BILA